MRPVQILATSLLCPAPHSGSVLDFDPIASGVPRKHLKTMTRAVQLGVAGVNLALKSAGDCAHIPPERRGLYVGASPQAGDAEDIAPALQIANGDAGRFAREGVPLIPPLWLVKGLSNNVLGYASAQHDLRGDNGNWCDGARSATIALEQAWWAVAEGRVDLAIAGGADCLIGAEVMLGVACAEGAAFVVFGVGEPAVELSALRVPADPAFGELGAATGAIAFVRAWRG